MTQSSTIRNIILNVEETNGMSRRRHQTCPVNRTRTKGGKNDQWKFRYRIDVLAADGTTEYKEQPPKYLGYCRDLGKREAERLRDEFLETINSPAMVIPAQVKFGVVLEKYLGNCSVRDVTLRNYKATANAHISPRWGETRMCDVRQLDFEQWLLGLSRTMGKETFGKVKLVFGETWNCALRWGFATAANPVGILPKNFGMPRAGRKLTMPTEDEFARFIAAVREPWGMAAQIMMYTGLRVSETLGLRWQDFDADTLRVEWTVTQQGERQPLTKTERSARAIPVGHLRSIVRRPATARPSDWIFDANYSACYREIKRAAASIGIDQKGFGCHMFRRGHNTIFRRLSTPELAMQQMGHANVATNDIYFFEGDPEMKARAKVAEMVMGKVTGLVN